MTNDTLIGFLENGSIKMIENSKCARYIYKR
jgi:hypothetical protein